jgi:hypothetical protein
MLKPDGNARELKDDPPLGLGHPDIRDRRGLVGELPAAFLGRQRPAEHPPVQIEQAR